MDLVTKSLSKIGEDVKILPPEFSWSPDSQKIAFTSAKGLYILNIKHKSLINLGWGGEPSWSPNGKWIAYIQGGIKISNSDGNNTIKLTNNSDDYIPVWTSDSKKVVFQRYSPEDRAEIGYRRGPRIFVVAISGENLRCLTAEKGYYLGHPDFGD